jgi:hypothetical protein
MRITSRHLDTCLLQKIAKKMHISRNKCAFGEKMHITSRHLDTYALTVVHNVTEVTDFRYSVQTQVKPFFGAIL